jgi:hypothetical protein
LCLLSTLVPAMSGVLDPICPSLYSWAPFHPKLQEGDQLSLVCSSLYPSPPPRPLQRLAPCRQQPSGE